MKTKILEMTVAVGVLCFVTGCETSGLSSREQAGASYPNYILSLQSKTPAARQNPVFPLRLAVAEIGEASPPRPMLDKLETAPALISAINGLPAPGATPGWRGEMADRRETQEVPDRMQELCRLAQASGADYLFLFGGNIDSWRQGNALTFLDITLIGGAIFPGTRIKAEGKAAGALIDVATGRPVLFASADDRRSVAVPTLLAEGKRNAVNSKLRDDLTAALADELLRKLTSEKLSTGTARIKE